MSKYEIIFIIESEVEEAEEIYEYLWQEGNLFSDRIHSGSMRWLKDGD